MISEAGIPPEVIVATVEIAARRILTSIHY